ncbi:MAG: hypothetical protein FWG91_13120 [Lachnospiraceae bacterium]|nr:hypothetical protein [Lachnospiraceae bacterium]
MTKSEKKDKSILSSLKCISNKGIILYLDGKLATPDEIAYRCINDKAAYMPDYIMDDKGTLKEIRYDKVVLE